MDVGTVKAARDNVNSASSVDDCSSYPAPDAPDPIPKWRATFFILLNRRRLPVLGDSGCTGSCIDYDYFVKNPYLKRFFTPRRGSGTAINGSEVPSIGEVKLKFLLGDVPMSITCKVIKNLMEPVILGWNWISKYDAWMSTSDGKVHFCGNKSVPLMPYDGVLGGLYYKTFEDLVLPPSSKILAKVELVRDSKCLDKGSSVVITDPFSTNTGNYCAARSCANVANDQFVTEFINCSNASVRIPAGEIIGNAEFVDEDYLSAATFETEMYCSYVESPGANFFGASTRHIPEKPTPRRPSAKPPPTNSSGPKGGSPVPEDIPPGAKPLSQDYSKMAPDARPYEPQLRELLEVKRKEAFSKHDRDYGKTDLIQYRAHMKDRNQTPLAQRPYRTRPEVREVVDQQAQTWICYF